MLLVGMFILGGLCGFFLAALFAASALQEYDARIVALTKEIAELSYSHDKH